MKLLTAEILKALPPLYATDDKPKDQVKVPLKLFNPCGKATWWLWEFDGKDTFFGAVDLGMTPEPEMGYVSLAELQSLRLPMGLKVERDLHWDKNTTVADVMSGKAR